MDPIEQATYARLRELGVPLCPALTDYLEQDRLRREWFKQERAAAAQRCPGSKWPKTTGHLTDRPAQETQQPTRR
jgi:hypothetical protein